MCAGDAPGSQCSPLLMCEDTQYAFRAASGKFLSVSDRAPFVTLAGPEPVDSTLTRSGLGCNEGRCEHPAQSCSHDPCSAQYVLMGTIASQLFPQTGTVWGPLLRKKSVTRLARWVSRASGLWSPMVSDHERNWGHRGRVVSRASGLWSGMVSDHEHNWGHWRGVAVARYGPVVSTVSDHERNWGHWGRVGVTRFGPVVSHGLRS